MLRISVESLASTMMMRRPSRSASHIGGYQTWRVLEALMRVERTTLLTRYMWFDLASLEQQPVALHEACVRE